MGAGAPAGAGCGLASAARGALEEGGGEDDVLEAAGAVDAGSVSCGDELEDGGSAPADLAASRNVSASEIGAMARPDVRGAGMERSEVRNTGPRVLYATPAGGDIANVLGRPC